MTHPIQPIEADASGILRFRGNAIVRFLLDAGPFDMNTLAMMEFSVADREQFAQLIGYSLSGFSELSYVTDATYEAAVKMARRSIREMSLTDTAQSTVDLLRQYDCPHLQQAATDLQAAIVADLMTGETVIAPGPWKSRGAPPLDRGPIIAAIRENAAKPPAERRTQAELAAVLGISVKTLAKAWRESQQSP
jgi:hypothetical protein